LRGGEFGAESVKMRDGFGVGHDPHSKAEGHGTSVSGEKLNAVDK
jgi:hypothetical protein